MDDKQKKKILEIAEFADNPEHKTFAKLLELEDLAISHKDEIKETHKEHLLEVLSNINDKIDNIEKPEIKDYEDCLERIEKKLNEPNEIEVVLNIV